MKEEASEIASQVSAIHVLVAACDARSSGDLTSCSPPETPRSVSEMSSSETVAPSRGRPRSGSQPQQRQPQRGVNASRDRMKQEMLHLRDTVEELQRQLDEIKRDHVRRSPRPLVPATASAAQLVAAWECMARGQCEQRYRAEVENVKLRKMLDEQVKIAQTLERILTKRRSAEHWLGGQRGAKRARSSSIAPLDQSLPEMHALLPSLYAQVEAVLAKDCFSKACASGAFRNVDVRQSDDTGTYVEATEKRLLPFSHGDVGEALWESFVCYPDYNTSSNRDELQSHVMERDIEMCLQLPRFTGPVRLAFTARRYVDLHRVVVVWVALVDPSGIAEPALDGVQIRHTGWVCSRPSTLPNAMTEYVSAQVSAPEFLDGSSDRKRRVGTLTTFIVSSLHSHLDTTKQTIDNCLLERSRRESSPATLSLQ